MEQLYHTTELIGIKDKNIKILFILKHQTHLEIRAKLDYDSPG
ncbi:ISL3 family transposase, partial [Streptococcus suis]